MATSGTYNFSPAIGEVGLYAFKLIGVNPPGLTVEQMADLKMATNLMLAEWSNQQVNLWEVKLGSINLVQGTATYNLPANCMLITDAYIETQGTTANPLDRVITSISRSFYSTLPNKQQQGAPTVFWHDRILAPTITLWNAPDQNGPYVLFYYYVSQIQDANAQFGQTADVPVTWLRAFASGLAAEMAPIYAPEKEQFRRADAQRSLNLAISFNTENAPIFISPKMSSYYR